MWVRTYASSFANEKLYRLRVRTLFQIVSDNKRSKWWQGMIEGIVYFLNVNVGENNNQFLKLKS